MAKISFTAGRVDGFKCPATKAQAFLWDITVSGLALRATPAGQPSYVFQSRYQDKTIRLTIGSPKVWSIPQAQEKARELQRMIDEGRDPRSLKRDALADNVAQLAAAAAQIEAAKVAALTMGEVWATYIEARKQHWGDLHYRDHINKAKPGGLPSGRRGGGKELTKPGPLAALMPLPLKDLDQATIETWAVSESKTRQSSARLALRLLGVFLTWCSEQKEYAGLLPTKNPAKTRKSREVLGKGVKKRDALQREQLPVWFDAVMKIRNPYIAAYLQIMLLTGARPSEILTIKWEGVDFKWKALTIRDKINRVTRERVIPLPPYIAHLLSKLPRQNKWVFFSPTSASGHIAKPNNPHTTACAAAGIDHLTLHGLRRSFKGSSEWLDIANGVRQNIMGHVARSTDEDYTIRPLDLLRIHHERIEAWILEQAGVVYDDKAEPGKLVLVAG